MKISKNHGFTLIELLVSISIIGLIGALAAVSFSAYRANGRDSKRTADMDSLRKALNIYQTSSATGYPVNAAGICLADVAGNPGRVLKNARVIAQVPIDPRFSTSSPASASAAPRVATSGNGFCYYYWANATDYRISYYLETKTGNKSAGINFISPSN